jgi:sialic acid synthase SpsE
VRPADGLDPSCYPVVLGRLAARDLEAGTPVTWSVLR